MSAFTADQRKLMELMWRVAEEAWSAGWKQGLEFDLWRILSTGPEKYGQMQIEAPLIRELQECSEKTGGWIYFDPVEQEVWVDLAAWMDILEKAESTNPTPPR